MDHYSFYNDVFRDNPACVTVNDTLNTTFVLQCSVPESARRGGFTCRLDAEQGVGDGDERRIHVGFEHQPFLDANSGSVRQGFSSLKANILVRHMMLTLLDHVVCDLHGFLWATSEDRPQVKNTTIYCVTTAANVTEVWSQIAQTHWKTKRKHMFMLLRTRLMVLGKERKRT